MNNRLLYFILIFIAFSCDAVPTNTEIAPSEELVVADSVDSAKVAKEKNHNTQDDDTKLKLSYDSISTNNPLYDYYVDLSELPYDYNIKIKKIFKFDSIDINSNQIKIKNKSFEKYLKRFFNTGILNTNAFNEYQWLSIPKLSYWEFIIKQLPPFVNYGYKYNGHVNKLDLKDKLFAYLVYRINREPKNIKNLYDTFKIAIYNMIDKKNYASTPLKNYVDNLLKSYDHLISLEDYDSKIQGIINQVNLQDRKKDEDLNLERGRTRLQYSIYEPVLSVDFNKNVDDLWFYSFWIRRYKEKNSVVIYNILKDIEAFYYISPTEIYHWESNKSNLFIPIKPTTSNIGFKEYLKTNYELTKHNIIDSAYGEYICTEELLFSNGLKYHYKCGLEGKNDRNTISFPKIELNHLKKLIEMLYDEPDNHWGTPYNYVPKEGMGCNYIIDNEVKDSTIVSITCGC